MCRFSWIAIVVMMLLSSTACSGEVPNMSLPPVPEFTGDCGVDLNRLVEDYVIPLESQRR